MSKKYFINNLDTAFGQALISELVKQPTQDPVHMCTVRAPVEKKPQGIKKILKRDKPKLFRKKAIQQCQVYIYNVDQTEISDVIFGIQTMQKPFEENKVFILVSDIMAWSNSPRKIKKQAPPPPPEDGGAQNAAPPAEAPPQEANAEEGEEKSQEASQKQASVQEKPIEYTYYQDGDYADRVPLSKYQYIKQIEDKVLSIKRQNVKVFIVCPGIIYGCGQDTFYQIFKAAWLQQPQKLPYLGEGNNKIPTIHLKDLVKFVIKIAQSPPEGSPYLLAFDQTQNKTQKSLVQVISSGVGSGKITNVKQSPLIENPDRYLIDLDMKSSKVLIGTTEEPVQFEWVARKGMKENIASLLKDFWDKQKLRPIKLLCYQNDQQWKQSKISFIHKSFSQYYRIPVLNIRKILQSVKELADQELCNDLKEQWTNIMNYLTSATQVKQLTETMKVFYRAVRWRLTQNDCQNRGYILENFPNFVSEVTYIFNKVSLKKFKRKVPKPIPPPPKVSQNQIGSEGQVPPPPEEPKQQEPKEEEPAQQEAAQEEAGPKTQVYYPQSFITIKRMGTDNTNQDVLDFFTSAGMLDLIYDTSNLKEHQIFQSLRNYIQRNGRPNNYLVPEEDLYKKHQQFVITQNKISLDKKERQVKKKIDSEADVQAKRKKLAEEVFQIVRNEGEEEIKKMPFRNYLMQFVVPTLNEGLLQVSNIIPNDPVDLLAEYLYQKSYDV